MPWMVAATVRSLAHMKSLRNYGFKSSDTTTTSSTPVAVVSSEGAVVEMIGVQEQRVSGLAIHSLIGAALLFGRHLLRQIPTSVLTGLFLYLGFSSIGTTDLYDRSRLFLMDNRDLPISKPYMKEVGAKRTKIFTSIQIALLGSMWWIKETKLGVFFPVLIGILAPIRIALEKWNVFSKKELETLDGEIG